MAEATITRKLLRQRVCLDLEMPFYQRFPTGSALTSTASGKDRFVDTSLTQSHKFWKGGWVLWTSGTDLGQHRRVVDFWQDQDTAILEWDAVTLPASGVTYEIMSIWSPPQIHSAITSAIKSAFPAFFEVLEDSTLVYQEDKKEYSLSTLTNLYRVLKVWLEQPSTGASGTVVSAGATTLVVASGSDLSKMVANPTNWRVTIYAGKGKGQIRTPSSAVDATDTITVTAWTTTPDATSKYRYWDATSELYNWVQIPDIRQNRKKYADVLTFLGRYPSLFGVRIRIQYIREPIALVNDAATTVVPEEYISLKARSILMSQRTGDARTSQRYMQDSQLLDQMAQQFLRSNHWNMPDGTIWTDTGESNLGGEMINPLDMF